jgi:elongation factor P--beta-lysine ligase
LAPHCTRISLADLPDQRDEERLLYAMGFETANIHLGARDARKRIRRELRARASRGRWLHDLSKSLAAAIEQDWERWRSA